MPLRRWLAAFAFTAGVVTATPGAAQTPAAAPPAAATTFTEHVAPIVFKRCVTCHHPEGPAPFSLLTYASARQHARQMAMVTASRYMPPVKAEPSPRPFVNQERLTPAEIAVFERWAAGGALEGPRAALPPVPRIESGWQLGTPDLVVPMPAYEVAASGTDVFRIFVIRLPTDRPRYVRGLEFRPGPSNVVHHANIRVDRTPASRRLDADDPGPGYEGLLSHSAIYPDGHFLAWTPGQAAPLLPKGLAWRLEPNTDLVVELHLQPTGKPDAIHPMIGLYFTDDPPAQTPGMIRLGKQNIDISPGDSRYIVTDSVTLPVPVRVLALQPHAHYRARQVEGTATLPDGTRLSLIDIPDWDFRWQQVYRYQTPVALPAGTTLAMRYVYDNSAENPRNVTQPPQRVIWGQRSADEMGDLWIQVLTANDADLDRLLATMRPKVIAEDIVGYEARIRAEPDSAPLHDDVALLYLEQGQTAPAVRHFERSALLRPQSAAAQFNLGTALAFSGLTEDAERRYRDALRLSPDYALAHNNLGGLLLQRGATAEARTHLEAAVRLDPANADARFNLGRLLSPGDPAAACAQFAEAVRLRPGWEAAAQALAACGPARR